MAMGSLSQNNELGLEFDKPVRALDCALHSAKDNRLSHEASDINE